MSEKNEPKLCYVSGSWAYFTTQNLKDQCGDDWNDKPYEHNAGTPYEYSDYDKKEGKSPWEIVRVAFYCDLSEPREGHSNSPYSVDMINHNELPWLTDYWGKSGFVIKAGTTLEDFIKKINERGGSVYLKSDSLTAESAQLRKDNEALQHELGKTMCERGAKRTCGHFVQDIMSFCPVCREVEQLRGEVDKFSFDNRRLREALESVSRIGGVQCKKIADYALRESHHYPLKSLQDQSLLIEKLREAVKPLARFMLTAEPGEYMRDASGGEIHWHDTERAREALLPQYEKKEG